MARGLSSPAACGILVPRPGIEPPSPVLEGGFSTTGPPGKSLSCAVLKVLLFRFSDCGVISQVPERILLDDIYPQCPAHCLFQEAQCTYHTDG